MTAADLQATARAAAVETARLEALTNQATTSGLIFDYHEPLPPMPDYRTRSWEPAARHYRDLTGDERKEYDA